MRASTDPVCLRGLLRLLGLLIGIAAAASCAEPMRRYPMQAPVWNDPDRNHVPQRPAIYYSGTIADMVDNIALRPLSRAFTIPVGDEALNVNSLDEVPNSSWFTNRIGLRPMTPDQVQRGPCTEGTALDRQSGPWVVVAAKPDGANPGFLIQGPDGIRYLLKFDGLIQPLRATSGDVVGSKLYYAFGFNVPCNEVVFFSPDRLVIQPNATRKNDVGESVPLTRSDIDRVLAAAVRTDDGLLRAAASRFLPGKPLGPFRYMGTRADDPNDVIPHERRRELRGGRLIAAWLNHYDARDQNSLDVWIDANDRSYVRHYYLDWGDCLGSHWSTDQVSRRLGYAGYFDYDQVAGDLFTLGMLSRPWDRVTPGHSAETFGYFGDPGFLASEWRAAYSNPAFERMSDRDALWAARIIARFGDDQIRAAVDSARLPEELAHTLSQMLVARRDRILEEYLRRLSPLTRFSLARETSADPQQALCFEDDAVRTRVAEAATTNYQVNFFGGGDLAQLGSERLRPDSASPARSCVTLPPRGRRPADFVGRDAPDSDPRRYGVVEILTSQRPGVVAATASVRVHLYDLGPARGFRIVGIERRPGV